MRAKFIKGMTAGALIGAAAGMMLIPQMDRSTRKKMQRTGRIVKDRAEDVYENMMTWMK